MTDLGTEAGSTANRYEILARLAVGGMAEIFLARTESQAGVERHVVLKRVLGHRATDIKHVHMFLDEARLAAQLQHPNIAQVFDTGKLGNSYFFTMEYVHGETVRELMHRAYELQQKVPIGCALTIIAGAAAGLQHAHDRLGVDGKPLGIVHRDVSPSNLMISYEGSVKVVDFGVAKAADRSIETQTGTVKGKIGYMAPEQCRGGIVDRRCDLFCLGIVMWEILVGERLFKRATDFESMEAIDSEPAPPPSSIRPDIPKELDEIVLTLLEKSPDDRYQTADEFLEELEKVAVKIGCVLSAPALRRFLGEVFGTRPEPWVELRRGDDRSETVTVTGAPVNGGQADPILIDTQLLQLRDLSTPPRDEMPARTSARRPTPAAMRRADLSPALDGQTGSTSSIDHRARTRQRWVVAILIASGVAMATAGVAIYLARGTREPTTTPRPGAAAGVVATRDAGLATPPPRVVPDAGAIAQPEVDASAGSASEVAPATVVDIDELWRAGRYADVVAACDADPEVVAAHAESCTLAACREHHPERARELLAHVGAAHRRSTIDECKKVGTRLVASAATAHPKGTKPDPTKPDPTKPDPKKPACDDPDPMACRH